MKWSRITLGAAGLVLILVGATGMVTDVSLLPELAIWLAGAVMAHDGILVPAQLLVGMIVWRASARLPGAVRQVVVGGLMVAGMLSLLAWPLIIRAGVVANPTALAQPYGRNLVLLLAITAAVTVVLATVTWWRSRRRPTIVELAD